MAQIGNTQTYDSSENSVLNTQRASSTDAYKGAGTLAVTSTNVEVFANDMKVGFIQSLTPSESRNIVKVQELGTEGVVQSVPSNTNGGQISVSRFALYNSSLWNALGLTASGKFIPVDQQNAGTAIDKSTTNTYGNPFRTLKDQRVPIEIKVTTRMNVSNVEKLYIETYIDCWLSSYSKSIAANTITITESATIQYSDVKASMPQ